MIRQLFGGPTYNDPVIGDPTSNDPLIGSQTSNDPLIRQLFGGQTSEDSRPEVVSLNSSVRGHELQLEVKRIQDQNRKPIAIFQVTFQVYSRSPFSDNI
jgi:hypothetical protein